MRISQLPSRERSRREPCAGSGRACARGTSKTRRKRSSCAISGRWWRPTIDKVSGVCEFQTLCYDGRRRLAPQAIHPSRSHSIALIYGP